MSSVAVQTDAPHSASLRGEVLTNVLNPQDRGVLGCDTAGRAREKETVLSHVLRVLPTAVAKPA
jgi:hypothetical protein